MYKKYIVVKFGPKKCNDNFNLVIFTDLCLKNCLDSKYHYTIDGIVLDTNHVYNHFYCYLHGGLPKSMQDMINSEGGRFTMPINYYEVISATNIKKEAIDAYNAELKKSIDAYDAELKKSIDEITNEQSEELKSHPEDVIFQAMAEQLKKSVKEYCQKEIIKEDISKQKQKKEKEIKEEKKMSIKDTLEKEKKEKEAAEKAKIEAEKIAAKKAAEEAFEKLRETTPKLTISGAQQKLKIGEINPVLDENGNVVMYGNKLGKQKTYIDKETGIGLTVTCYGKTKEELKTDEEAWDNFLAQFKSISEMKVYMETAYECNEAGLDIEEKSEFMIGNKLYFITDKINLRSKSEAGKIVATLPAACSKLDIDTRKELLMKLLNK